MKNSLTEAKEVFSDQRFRFKKLNGLSILEKNDKDVRWNEIINRISSPVLFILPHSYSSNSELTPLSSLADFGGEIKNFPLITQEVSGLNSLVPTTLVLSLTYSKIFYDTDITADTSYLYLSQQ